MPGSFQLVLDTTGPGGVAVKVNADANYANARDVTVDVTTTDPDTTGYQVKLWGDVDPAADPNVQPTEAGSSWITLAPGIAVRLVAGDGTKTINARLRDDVWNPSGTASDQINLDTTVPVVSITAGPDVARISKIAGKDTSSLTWTSDSDFQRYEVRVVPNAGSDHTTGQLIPATNGSVNVAGGAGAANTPKTTQIKGADLQAASSQDGPKQLKVFVQDLAGNWSTN